MAGGVRSSSGVLCCCRRVCGCCAVLLCGARARCCGASCRGQHTHTQRSSKRAGHNNNNKIPCCRAPTSPEEHDTSPRCRRRRRRAWVHTTPPCAVEDWSGAGFRTQQPLNAGQPTVSQVVSAPHSQGCRPPERTKREEKAKQQHTKRQHRAAAESTNTTTMSQRMQRERESERALCVCVCACVRCGGADAACRAVAGPFPPFPLSWVGRRSGEQASQCNIRLSWGQGALLFPLPFFLLAATPQNAVDLSFSEKNPSPSRLRGGGAPEELSFPPDADPCGLPMSCQGGGVRPPLSRAARPPCWRCVVSFFFFASPVCCAPRCAHQTICHAALPPACVVCRPRQHPRARSSSVVACGDDTMCRGTCCDITIRAVCGRPHHAPLCVCVHITATTTTTLGGGRGSATRARRAQKGKEQKTKTAVSTGSSERPARLWCPGSFPQRPYCITAAGLLGEKPLVDGRNAAKGSRQTGCAPSEDAVAPEAKKNKEQHHTRQGKEAGAEQTPPPRGTQQETAKKENICQRERERALVFCCCCCVPLRAACGFCVWWRRCGVPYLCENKSGPCGTVAAQGNLTV